MKSDKQLSFGIIGLGTMGRNMLLNMADHGFVVAGYDKNTKQVASLAEEDLTGSTKGFSDITAFIQSFTGIRAIMLLVPAGKIVDDVLSELLPLLNKGDIIIDGGNSHFTDTERRYKDFEQKGFHFIGMGVSGGEQGARRGPSMMPGGDKNAYESIAPILKKIAAHVNSEPTVAFMGLGSAGHFVKMVHNGIEYAMMQLLSETYELLKKGLKLNDNEIHDVFKKWNEGRLQSYLLEITRDIFAFKNTGESTLLVNDIKDEAKAKGTGKWTSQTAMDLTVPISIIDISVAMRDLSKYKTLRTQTSQLYPNLQDVKYAVNTQEYLSQLEEAFYFSMVSAYSQGMHLLYQANIVYKYELNLELIAKIWRGGCIIRAAFLEDIYSAYKKNPKLEHLFLDNSIKENLTNSSPAIRTVVCDAVQHGIAVPAFSASLSYFDALRNENMPANLIQAQRDFFGAHTYERTSSEGIFHTDWLAHTNK